MDDLDALQDEVSELKERIKELEAENETLQNQKDAAYDALSDIEYTARKGQK
jgi:FtsZ-binding cell division protein ZapB